MSTIAFLGYGRFGAALAGLFREAGDSVRAFDPHHSAVPEDARVDSLAGLCRDADFIVLAVPVTLIGDAAASVRPHLGPGQIVFDVGSVKVAPCDRLVATLGGGIPWVGTHPLFGPVSLLRGERPLRAVVCGNALHPAAVDSVSALFSRIGCEVLLQDAHEHDRAMAFTHALAFFVAKGMLDAGAPPEARFAPPSYQAIARTIASVREDAGHLFSALHRENPYAAPARRALLDALLAADRELHDGARTQSAEVTIPELGSGTSALSGTRDLIEEIDREIEALLARRVRLSGRGA